jgi:hypothetical protein
MKINLIGAYGVEGMHTHLAEMLPKYGVEAAVNSTEYGYFDANMFMGLWNLNEKVFWATPQVAAYGCGSDVWQGWSNLQETHARLLRMCDHVLYGHPDMQKVTGVPGQFWHVPIDTDLFCIQPSDRYNCDALMYARDVLMYAPNPGTYCLDKIMDYVDAHPEQKCTLLGTAYQNLVQAPPPENLKLVDWTSYSLMRWVYLQHKEFRLWLSTPATPMSNMEAEALRMGLKVFRNDQEVTRIPEYMFMEEAMPRLKNFLST